MDFVLSDIQAQFKASLRRFVADRIGENSRDDPTQRVTRWRTDHWREFADLGVSAALISEADGGFGGDAVDVMIVMEELGRGLVPTPFIERIVIGAGLIARLGSQAQKERWLPDIIGDGLDVATAHGDLRGGSGSIRVIPDDHGFRIDGRQAVVSLAPECDLLLVAARAKDGISLFAVRPDLHGITLSFYQSIDDRPACSVIFDGLRVERGDLVGAENGAGDGLIEIDQLATVAHCAEAMGIMASLLNATIVHLKTRQQFGQPLAQFQALQHRLVDMYLGYELAVSSIYRAAILVRDPGDAACRAVSGAKIQTVEAARLIGHESIQMHGAMGMTAELPIGRAVKRLKVMETQYGSPAFHLRRYQMVSPV